jgi:hypothetical protein
MLQPAPVFPLFLPESQFHSDCSALLSNWVSFVGGNRGADITGLHALSQNPYAKRWLLPRVIWHPLAVSALGSGVLQGSQMGWDAGIRGLQFRGGCFVARCGTRTKQHEDGREC